MGLEGEKLGEKSHSSGEKSRGFIRGGMFYCLSVLAFTARTPAPVHRAG